jgi:dienelactone hydrolase
MRLHGLIPICCLLLAILAKPIAGQQATENQPRNFSPRSRFNRTIRAAVAKKPNASVYSYPGQCHAFSRHSGRHYNAAAAHLANGRTSEFLSLQLR